MPIARQQKSRRQVLQAGMATGFIFLPAIAGVSSIVNAAETMNATGRMTMDTLIAALQTIGGPVCLNAAQKLAGIGADSTSFDLHLRNAGMNAQDARILGGAMQSLPSHSLRSFSASYNPDLKDSGAIVLANAFPTTMTELGLVGCSISDAGGAALLAWAQQASRLRMICVEGNNFSAGLKSDFTKLGRSQTSLMVVV